MVQLRHATTNLQQLVAKLSASLWDKATDQERRFPQQLRPIMPEEPVPAIAEVDLMTTHYTPVYLDTKSDVLDVERACPISHLRLPKGWSRPSLLRRSLQGRLKTLGF